LFVSRPIKDEEIEHIELLLRFRFFIQAFLTKTIHSCMAELCFAAKKKENLIYDSTTYYPKREREGGYLSNGSLSCIRPFGTRF
jgi:hypothetical protein